MEIKRTRIADLLKRTDYGQEVLVKGWVRTKRGSKTVSFIALNDGSTIKNVQIVADLEKFSDELMKLITTGACLSVKGIRVESIGSGQSAFAINRISSLIGNRSVLCIKNIAFK